ncbi:unnamed protein product [Rotaria magnacalcarata]|uniref:Uncharacterized protein n=1 Tax=Rotaria magnacalcarata TaxID=392030 RepID=A0A819CJY4_9BILA|nr:unnamed protein product [Rotaria magnacalcarata]CAF1639170.1 unnamed protein product [Rotaria magnacalcarata]CAF1938977.1 unnamed protein product [Rotaria magnacalcarata]CAF2032161.1 unnamed protein product [Rotaria magnacalcarata]CAF2150954.1 unnamed protein product [Rotaria magnacalcarata]
MLIRIRNDTYYQFSNNLSSSVLCANTSINSTLEKCTYEIPTSSSSTATNNLFSNSLLIIFVLSILSILGVCFMIFGPLQRSEAYKRVENFTFGRHPIFNVDNREVSATARYDESMEFADD